MLVFTFLYNIKSRWVILEIKDNKETNMFSTEGQILPQDYEFLTEVLGGCGLIFRIFCFRISYMLTMSFYQI